MAPNAAVFGVKTSPSATPRVALQKPATHATSVLETEFVRLRSLIEKDASSELLDAQLADWLEPNDDRVPYKFLTWPLRKVLNTPFSVFAASWSTNDRLERFIDLLSRAHQATCSVTGVVDENAATGARSSKAVNSLARNLSISGKAWRTWCEVIDEHRLSSATLGALAPSLNDLPSSFWERPLSDFTTSTYRELSETPGLGATKMSVVVDVVREVSSHLEAVPAQSSLGVILMPHPIRELSVWLSEVLEDRRIPDPDEIAASFCRPLQAQLQIDLTPEVAAIALRRIRIDGTSETLADIASDVGLTRERVRQLTQRAKKVLHVRWPQGKHLLDDLYELLHSAPNAKRQVNIIRMILDRCFDVDFATGKSRDEVMDAFRVAASRRLTPMTEDDLAAWAATRFGRITPNTVLRWVSDEAGTWTDSSDKQYYFSDDPWDTLLLMICSRQEPLAMTEAAQFLGIDERSVSGRVSRDQRFVQLDDKQVHAACCCGIHRIDGEWRIELSSVGPSCSPVVSSISVDSLVAMVASGFLQAGISDATVWGVHRYVNQLVESAYNGALPGEVTPFALQEVLVSHSRGRIRRMRRRRLRWDTEHTTPARGKIGWISHVARLAGIPMTIEEMQRELRQFYQDYELHALQQLNIDEADGDASLGVSAFRGVPQRVPPLIIPDSWEWDSNTENISEELKIIAGKVVDIGRRRALPRSVFNGIPWMIAIVDFYAFGKMKWQDNGDNTPLRSFVAESGQQSNADDSSESSKEADTAETKSDSNDSNLKSIVEELDGLL